MRSFMICTPNQMLFMWSNKEVDGKACGMYCGEVKYMGGFGAKA